MSGGAPRFVARELKETADISRGDTSWVSFAKNALSVVIVLAGLYLLLGLAAELVAASIPDRWEVKLFSWSFPEAEITEGRSREVFDRLAAGPGLRPLPYSLYRVPLGRPNAFALPGGGIGLTPELLDEVESETGLAMVIGHELGHHHHRHTLRRMGRALLLQVTTGLLFGGTGAGTLAEGAVRIAESGYSRRQETQADEFALRLVLEHYGHTEGSLEFFEDLRDRSEKDGARWESFFETHPFTPDRIEHLEEYARELQAGD